MRHALALMVQKLRAVWPTTLKSRFAWAFFASAISVTLVVLFSPASAVGETPGNWLITGLAQIMLAMANLAIGLCLFFLRFFIAIASYNNYIDVDVVQLGWVMVRDVANMFFVVALLVIAFGTILGLEEYEWKKNLVKLIFAAIFINFSNLIAQLFIDVAHVFTMTFLNAISATSSGNLINMFKLDQITQMVGVNPDVNTEFNIEILAGTAIAALFAVLAAFIMGSYVYVMMARVVALWALIILSPLAYILGVLPKTQSYAERWWSEFTNHVIVAPIMVFFLWLAFATLGTGNILASIQEDIPVNNKIDGTKSVELVGANFVESGDPTKLSLSKVSTWENMANFLIALAFLRVGVKTTEETGVWGSDMISDAWEFGKKAATIATGYAAGRWLMDRGTDTLKTGASALAYRAPLVGGRALTNYANWGKLKAGKLAIWRDDKAKAWEKTEKDLRKVKNEYLMGDITEETYRAKRDKIHNDAGGYAGRGWNLLKASVFQTNGRAEKKAEDWKKAVEAQKSYIEENYSTSDSAGGRVKLEWGILAHKAEEMAHSKKDQKYAEGEELLLNQEEKRGGGYLSTLEDTTNKAKAAAEAAKDRLAAHTEGELEKSRIVSGAYEAKARLENEREKIKIQADQLQESARSGVGYYNTKNRAEEAKMDLDEQVARSRAKAYGKAGDTLRGNAIIQAALNERLKKDGELFATMGYDELMSQEEILTQMIADQLELGSEKDENKLKKLRKQKIALTTLNSKMDPDISRDSRTRALAALKINEMNDQDRLKNEMSRWLGEKVGSVAEGEKKLKEVFGGDGEQYQAALAALSRNYKTAGSAGDAGGLGLIRAISKPSEGITKYVLRTSDKGPAENNHADAGNTASFVQYMTLSKINDITGLTGSYIIKDGSRVNTGISERGKAVLKELFSGKDSRAIAQVNANALKQLDATEINENNKAAFKEVFDHLKDSMGNGGYEALIKMLPNLVKNRVADARNSNQNTSTKGISDEELRDAGVVPV